MILMGCFLSHEPMNDLVWILSQLTSLNGEILVPGLKELVAPVSKEESKLYEPIDFSVVSVFGFFTFRKMHFRSICTDLQGDFQSLTAAPKLIQEKKEDVLMARWRYPSLSIHG